MQFLGFVVTVTFCLFSLVTMRVSAAATLVVTQPFDSTVWQAGQPANVSWTSRNGQPAAVTVQLYPATDVSGRRIVSVLASNVPGNKNYVIFSVPDNVPAWMYAVRIYDPKTLDSQYAYSAAFPISDSRGSMPPSLNEIAIKGIQEPAFPKVPVACSDGTLCNTGGDDQENSTGTGNSILKPGDPRYERFKNASETTTSSWLASLFSALAVTIFA